MNGKASIGGSPGSQNEKKGQKGRVGSAPGYHFFFLPKIKLGIKRRGEEKREEVKGICGT